MRTDNERSHEPVVPPADWAQLRAKLLIEAGFPVEVAQRLGRQRDVDVHALLELVDRGCPPHLALRILAPIDEPSPR